MFRRHKFLQLEDIRKICGHKLWHMNVITSYPGHNNEVSQKSFYNNYIISKNNKYK